MESTLNIKGFKLNLNFEPQTSPQGKEIRLSGIAKNAKIPTKYLEKEWKNHWVYTFIYIGTDKFINFEFDYYDRFVSSFKS